MNLENRPDNATLGLGHHGGRAARVEKGKKTLLLDVIAQGLVVCGHGGARSDFCHSVLLHDWRVEDPSEEPHLGKVDIKVDGVGSETVVEKGLRQRVREIEITGPV